MRIAKNRLEFVGPEARECPLEIIDGPPLVARSCQNVGFLDSQASIGNQLPQTLDIEAADRPFGELRVLINASVAGQREKLPRCHGIIG
jgi:hypothetical protein